MRVLIAPDKFKGSLTAAEAAEAMERGVKRALPRTECATIPVSDGGEGLIEVALSSSRRGRRSGGDDAYADYDGDPYVDYDADLRVTKVRGPLGDDHDARWVLMKPSDSSGSHSRRMDEFTERFDGHDGDEGHDSIAVIEMAEASGLAWITPGPDASLRADSYGTGQLIRAAVEAGATLLSAGLAVLPAPMAEVGHFAHSALGSSTLTAMTLRPEVKACAMRTRLIRRISYLLSACGLPTLNLIVSDHTASTASASSLPRMSPTLSSDQMARQPFMHLKKVRVLGK